MVFKKETMHESGLCLIVLLHSTVVTLRSHGRQSIIQEIRAKFVAFLPVKETQYRSEVIFVAAGPVN